jgi:ferritin-like metal-binding protein YciE
MKRTNALSDLLIEELADLLSAENQLVEALPKIAQASQSSALKSALEDYLEVTRVHVSRLKDIFSNIGQSSQGSTCKTMKELIKESEDLVNKTEKFQSTDAALIWVAQRVEQYEIAEYKKAREHAADLGHTMIVELLTKTLNEQRAMNFHLNELAQGIINIESIDPKSPGQQKNQKRDRPSESKSGGFYVPEGRFNRKGAKKKTKSTDVSRFIDEGNPNVQDQNLQNPEDQGDLS